MRALIPLLACGVSTFAQSPGEKPDGKTLFERKCAACHSTETSERRIGPSLKGIKDGRLPDQYGKEATHDNILKQVDEGGGGMPVFRDLLSKDQKEAIIAYVLTL